MNYVALQERKGEADNYKKIKMLSCKFRYNSDYINFRKISRHNILIMVQSFQALYFQDLEGLYHF